MNKYLWTLFFLAALVRPADSKFSVGLGKAAAQQGNRVFAKAAEVEAAAESGNSVIQSLPSCGASPLYAASPVAIGDIQGIEPLGHVAPSAHTLPSDHIYFYIAPAVGGAPGARVVTNVVAPGNIRITNISYASVNGDLSTTDYGIQFYPCRELQSYFLHVHTLSPLLLGALNSAPQHCQDYSTGGGVYHRCDANANIALSTGDVMGTVGGTSAALDFGSYDFRRTPLPFLSSSRHYYSQAYTVCPIDYYEPVMKTILEGHLGRPDGLVARTASPLCGEILYDVANTAMGDWYHVGSPDQPEDPHLALIKDDVYNPRQVLSIGTSVPGVSHLFFPFDPLGAGTHNRDFAQVTSDGNVYCYDTFYDPLGQPAGPGYSLLLTMPTPSTLNVAKLNSASCGAGPWTMGGSYGQFQR